MIKLIVCYNPCTYMSTGTANCLFLLKPHMHAGTLKKKKYEKENNSRGSEQEYLTKYKNSYVSLHLYLIQIGLKVHCIFPLVHKVAKLLVRPRPMLLVEISTITIAAVGLQK